MLPEVSTLRNLCYFAKKKFKKIKFEKVKFTNNGVLQLYIAREISGSGGKLPDPAPDPDPAKRSGSDRIRIQIRHPVHTYSGSNVSL